MSKLAQTRPILFKEILRYRFFDLITCSLCVALFIIPNIIFNIFIESSFLNEFYLINYIVVYSLKIICFIIFGLGVSGGLYFMKRLTFGEGASVRTDFFLGIRKNYKTFILIYLLIGFIYALIKINNAILITIFSNNALLIAIFNAISYIFLMLIIIISIFMQTQTILYKASFIQLFINAVKFLVGNIFKNIGIFLLTMFPFIIIEFVHNYIVSYIAICFYGLIYFAIALLIINLYSNSIFDKSINKDYFPEMIRKGLNND